MPADRIWQVNYSVLKLAQTIHDLRNNYEGWNFNSGNYLFTTDTK